MNANIRPIDISLASGNDNPMEFVVEALSKSPKDDRKEQFKLFRSLLQSSPDNCQRAVDWYFFVNMRDSMRTAPPASGRRTVNPDMAAASKQDHLEMVRSIKAQVTMLDMLMPNEKPMRDCTGSEMAKFGNRYQRIAERVGKAKLVGAVLNEDEVRAIMK